MKSRFVLTFLILAFGVALIAADDPAKGHYESALYFLQNQKYQQAVDDLNFIVKSFPKSDYADDALLQLGLYYFDQEKKLDQALTYFTQIKDGYTNSNSAPPAYYYLGQIYLTKRDAAALDEAFANFERVTRVFPSSTWVDKSLVGAGTALKWRSEFDKAYEEFSKVKVRFADSPLAPQAQYEMGICSLYSDHFQEAVIDFQQVIDRFPASEYAKKAREVNTILYRLYIAPTADRKVYALDNGYAPALQDLDEPSGMAVDGDQNLYVADKGKKTLLVFDAAGKFKKSILISSPLSISIDPQNNLYIANDANVMKPPAEPLLFSWIKDGKTEPLEEIRSVAVNLFGEYFLVSGKLPGVLIYDHDRTVKSNISFVKTESEYSKVAVNSRNQLYALDKDHKVLTLFSQDAKAVYGIGPKGKNYDFDRIEDFAIDRTNHVYLLTKNPRAVFIFSPSGSYMRSIASDKKGVLAFEGARVIAVGPTGSIYVLDKDSKRILKIG
jgi:outer membrane protein assembly factor BamD (BamD/ComL family)